MNDWEAKYPGKPMPYGVKRQKLEDGQYILPSHVVDKLLREADSHFGVKPRAAIEAIDNVGIWL